MLFARVAKLGFITDLLSKPVLIGYLSGIAVTMVISQLGRALGTEVDDSSVGALVVDIANGVEANWYAVGVAVITVAIIVVFQRWVPRVPGTLVALGLRRRRGLRAAGVDHRRLHPHRPDAAAHGAADQRPRRPAAGGRGHRDVSYTDVIVTARAFAGGTDRVDPNREMAALGGVDVVGGLFGGYPISASSSRRRSPG